MIALKQMLIPTDFSEPSGVALRYAKAFAQTFQASMHLLHIIEPVYYGWEVPPVIDEEIDRGVEKQMNALLTDDERSQFRAQFVHRRGSAFVEIVRYAREQNIDLIVMGTHGRGPIAHMLLGSVAEKVVRKAPCPVLTVRHPEHEFVMP
jgi:nucleotide-binding universal stress UspA family protein